MASGLEHLLAEGILSEVVGRLKSGKEADVFAVRFGGKVVAAKVYKDRAHRSFKNSSAYQEGRSVRNSRSQRAMQRKTSFGQAASEAAWKSAEADALYKLYAAEVRVPAPVLFLDGVLLMELVLGEDGEPAPRVVDAALTASQANTAYHDMLRQLVRILSCDLIHGDLSPYNVLWGANGPTIIDFPQIVSASQNSSSEAFFLRDARNILGHFASIDKSLSSRGSDAQEIWRAYLRRELTPEFVPQGRAVPAFFGPPRREGAPRNGGHAPRGVRDGGESNGHPRPQGHLGRPSENGRAAPVSRGPAPRPAGGRPAEGARAAQPQQRAPQAAVEHRVPQAAQPQQRAPQAAVAHRAPQAAQAQRGHHGRMPNAHASQNGSQARAAGRHQAPSGAPSHGRRQARGPEVIIRIARSPRPEEPNEERAAPEANSTSASLVHRHKSNG